MGKPMDLEISCDINVAFLLGARVNIYEGMERGHMTIMPCCAAITQLLIQHNQGVCMGDILAKVATIMGRDPDITVPVIMSEADIQC